jgi:hypothetical protein
LVGTENLYRGIVMNKWGLEERRVIIDFKCWNKECGTVHRLENVTNNCNFFPCDCGIEYISPEQKGLKYEPKCPNCGEPPFWIGITGESLERFPNLRGYGARCWNCGEEKQGGRYGN